MKSKKRMKKNLRSSSPSTLPFDWKEYYGKGNKLGLIWKREQESMAGKKKRTKQPYLFFFLAGKREQVSELIAIVITTEEEVRNSDFLLFFFFILFFSLFFSIFWFFIFFIWRNWFQYMQRTAVVFFWVTRLIFDRHSYESSCFFRFDMNRRPQGDYERS